MVGFRAIISPTVEYTLTVKIYTMKTMTCAGMGGPCEEKVMGNTSEEMMGNGMKHMEAAHPEMAADIKAMPQDDPKMVAWSEKFMKDWEATPEDAQ